MTESEKKAAQPAQPKPGQQQSQQQSQLAGQPGQQEGEPGSLLPNPAEAYAQTKVPERRDASSFMKGNAGQPSGYPKLKYHPVHGGVEVKDPGEEGQLYPKTDWFDSPELADAARTWTEAEVVRVNNQLEKLKRLQEEEGHPVIRNSVQADEAIRRAQTEPL